MGGIERIKFNTSNDGRARTQYLGCNSNNGAPGMLLVPGIVSFGLTLLCLAGGDGSEPRRTFEDSEGFEDL